MKILRRYWGLVALALLLTAWWTTQVGPGVLYLLSGAVVLWSLFQAPAWCGASRSRDGFCRNNSRGLLLGCHLREHRWQKFKMLFYSSRWTAFSRGTWATPSAKLATVSGLIGSVSAIATGIKDFALS
ncbi:hypothetical protein AB0J94_17375 [Micromonospora noduli]|uniref:hypothetical protein n=1 Tax=Micromonospora noduli TaxID=709876 RepID=UPI003413C532